MRSRVVFIIFCFFVAVYCASDDNIFRQSGSNHAPTKTIREHGNLRDNQPSFNGGSPFSSSGEVINSQNLRGSERPPGSVGENSHSYERPYNAASGTRPGNEGHSGRPNQKPTYGQASGIVPDNEGGTRPGNEGHSGRPNQKPTYGQATGIVPDNEGNSSRKSNSGSEYGKPDSFNKTGSGIHRPGFNKKPEDSETETRPEKEQTQGIADGKEDDEDVCFPHLGCFKMGKPWKSTLRPISAPHAPEKIQTVVHFYSRQNPKQPQNITVYPKVNLGRAQFDPQKISAMIVHGFFNSGNATWMKEMKDVYLRKVDANVMIVDWGKGAQLLSYLQVAGNTRVVGKQLGMFVKYLIEKYGADPGRFHLIGHSLGAQICSYLAKDVPGIARLTALDPAQPGFEGFSKEVRLHETDAEFVDVIHTDARPFIPTLGFGMMAPHGHVDFYMNGGFDQPGCVPPPKKDLPVIKSFLDLAKFPVEAIGKIIACPHSRAYEYLIEAFNETDNCIFWGHKTDVKNVFKTVTNTVTQGLFKKFTALSTTCSKDDCIPLGFATKKSPLRGSFVVTTSGRSPFCISEPGVPPETLPRDRKEKSVIQKIKETPIFG